MGKGRKPDSAGLQAAKGNPGRRKKASAEQRAAVLAAAPRVGGDELAPPAMLKDRALGPARKVWEELAPELRRLNLLQPLDRYTFAMYCVHMADWIKANRDIQREGAHYDAPMTGGEATMKRLHPAVKVRELAEKHLLEIGARFGLDPANRYRLLRDQAAALVSSGGLFDREPETDTRPPASPAPEPDLDDDPVGLMRRMSAPPPESKPH